MTIVNGVFAILWKAYQVILWSLYLLLCLLFGWVHGALLNLWSWTKLSLHEGFMVSTTKANPNKAPTNGSATNGRLRWMTTHAMTLVEATKSDFVAHQPCTPTNYDGLLR